MKYRKLTSKLLIQIPPWGYWQSFDKFVKLNRTVLCILWLLSISFVKDYYIVLIKHSENKRSKLARIAVRKKLSVNLDKACLSQQTVGTVFQKSFVPENIHIGRELSMETYLYIVVGKICGNLVFHLPLFNFLFGDYRKRYKMY